MINFFVLYFILSSTLITIYPHHLGSRVHKNFRSVNKYARLPQHRIINGQKALLGQFPYQLSLRLDWRHICGASFVVSPTSGEHIAITSAHCVVKENTSDPIQASSLTILAGVINLDKEGDGTVLPVVRVVVHPEYKAVGYIPLQNDIAVLILGGRFNELHKYIRPIDLPSLDGGLSLNLKISGFGKTDPENDHFSKDLYYAQLLQADTKNCAENYKKAVGFDVLFETQFCLGGNGKADSCTGDSGGPAAGLQRGKPGPVLLGIISWGLGCNEPQYPGIYTDVRHYITWLESICKS